MDKQWKNVQTAGQIEVLHGRFVNLIDGKVEMDQVCGDLDPDVVGDGEDRLQPKLSQQFPALADVHRLGRSALE